MRRHDHAPDPELFGELAGVQWPGAAETDHGVVTRIVTAFDGHGTNRALHVRVHGSNHRQRQFLHAHVGRRGDSSG